MFSYRMINLIASLVAGLVAIVVVYSAGTMIGLGVEQRFASDGIPLIFTGLAFGFTGVVIAVTFLYNVVVEVLNRLL